MLAPAVTRNGSPEEVLRMNFTKTAGQGISLSDYVSGAPSCSTPYIFHLQSPGRFTIA